jgi:rubrerythrin
MQSRLKNPQAVALLEKLAKEEEKHLELLQALVARPEVMLEQIKLAADKRISHADLVFPDGKLLDENATIQDVLQNALDQELASYNVYENLAKLAKISFLKNTFDFLAREEEKHVDLLKKMIANLNA